MELCPWAPLPLSSSRSSTSAAVLLPVAAEAKVAAGGSRSRQQAAAAAAAAAAPESAALAVGKEEPAVAAKEAVEESELNLDCLGCRREAILKIRSDEFAMVMGQEEFAAEAVAGYELCGRLGRGPIKAIKERQRRVESESVLRVEVLDRCLEELELVCCNCVDGRALELL